jgi:putative tryptophan/tyrosine transport system substrate-binding protein
MRQRDFTIGLLLAAAAGTALPQEPAKQHRIAIIIPEGSVTSIDDPGRLYFRAFWEELRRLGDVEGQNLTVERYSGEGRPEGFADLARQVVSRNPDVIVASTEPVEQALHAATAIIPMVVADDPIQAGLAASLARPGGNVTGVRVYVGVEILGKRLQILKEAVPSASNVAYLSMRTDSPANLQQLQEASRRLEISVTSVPLQESAPSEYRRAFAEIAQSRPDAIVVASNPALIPYRQLIVELVEKSRLPAIYSWPEYAEAGGLMAHSGDNGELGRHMADDVHEILGGAKPGDIPVYQPAKYKLVINLKTANALGLTIPPALLATADEVIE